MREKVLPCYFPVKPDLISVSLEPVHDLGERRWDKAKMAEKTEFIRYKWVFWGHFQRSINKYSQIVDRFLGARP